MWARVSTRVAVPSTRTLATSAKSGKGRLQKLVAVELRVDRAGLGARGERVLVKKGFARNYLVPHALARPVAGVRSLPAATGARLRSVVGVIVDSRIGGSAWLRLCVFFLWATHGRFGRRFGAAARKSAARAARQAAARADAAEDGERHEAAGHARGDCRKTGTAGRVARVSAC